MCQKTSEQLLEQAEIESEVDDPVFFCQHCLDLKIMSATNTHPSYCGICGNLDIITTSFQFWEDLYLEEYGRKYLEQSEVQIFTK